MGAGRGPAPGARGRIRPSHGEAGGLQGAVGGVVARRSMSARLVCPALRWRHGSFQSAQSTITPALAAGVGGFILFGGTHSAVSSLTAKLRTHAQRALLIGSD